MEATDRVRLVSKCAVCGLVWYNGSFLGSCVANENHLSTISGGPGRVWRNVRRLRRVRGEVKFQHMGYEHGGQHRSVLSTHSTGWRDPGIPLETWGWRTMRRLRDAGSFRGGNPRRIAQWLQQVRATN